jgi:hypothetical protein
MSDLTDIDRIRQETMDPSRREGDATEVFAAVELRTFADRALVPGLENVGPKGRSLSVAEVGPGAR